MVDTYRMCIANSTSKGNRCTISWYVDNNKVSYIDEEVNTKVIETIAENFVDLTVSGGKKHNFLGMDIELLSEGKLSLIMKYYVG